MRVSRRTFLGTAAVSAGLPLTAKEAGKNKGIPMRVLGKTGRKVTILVIGGGSRYLSYKSEDQAAEALNLALDLGINYIDTAASYGNGKSEERVGKVLKGRDRDKIFLTTKVQERGYDDAMRQFERSLKLLGTDHVDLCHIHSLLNGDDLAKVEDGVLKAVYKLRDEKSARFIGVTSHTDPGTLKTALERHDFDCTQMALNAALAGMVSGKGGMEVAKTEGTFESLALPVANRKNMGVIAMKIFGQEGLVGEAPIAKLINYSWSLPVSACVIGMPKLEYIRENVQLAKQYRPMPASEMKKLSEEVSSRKKIALDTFFANHVDA